MLMRIFRPRTFAGLFSDAGKCWYRDDIPAMAAALAYHAILSLAPLLILLVGTAGMIFGANEVEGEIVLRIEETAGPRAAEALGSIIENFETGTTGKLAIGGTSIILLFIFASGFFYRIISSLNMIWRHENEGKPGVKHGVLRLIKKRFVSFLMILGMGLWLYLSLLIKAVAAIPEDYLLAAFPRAADILPRIPLLTSPFIFTVVFAILFKMMPEVKIRWSDVLFGSVVTALLFVVGHRLIALYLHSATLASFYGTAGSLVIILLWIYWAAMIFLFGAELTKAYTVKLGSRREDVAAL